MPNAVNPAERPTYEDLAGLIEYPLVRPELSEEDVSHGCDAAKNLRVSAVVVRPSDVDMAARRIGGSGVRLVSIVDSLSTTSVKVYAARDLLRRGVQEIDTTMNTGKLISRQFQYLETELLQMADACHQSGGLLHVNLQSEYLNEELKIIACRIAKRAGADFLGTSLLEDVALLKTHTRDRLKIKSTAQIPDLETALAFREAGCTRIQVSEPATILEVWKAHLAAASHESTTTSH